MTDEQFKGIIANMYIEEVLQGSNKKGIEKTEEKPFIVKKRSKKININR